MMALQLDSKRRASGSMKLDEALQQLDAITAAAERADRFDGLRWFPTALTSVVGLGAAIIQRDLMARSADPESVFVGLWLVVSAIALAIVLSDMALRYFRDPTARARRMTIEVLGRLAPSIVVGGALTIIISLTARQVIWMLPGLWSVLLGLGIFAASSLIPKRLQTVGIWYIGCGLAVLMLATGEHALSPWAMAIPFAGGQSFAAWLMYCVANETDSFQANDDT